ncbi:MAG: hypothetical protein LBD02_02745 [Christensenellaceae bacterium]|jgi:hypothetical protein|nr:hypothetical protein [Christensenellaceae bacterium]
MNDETRMEGIPEVLAWYLAKFAAADREIERMRLSPVRIEAGMAQSIALMGRRGAENRLVFGFEPVEARLLVPRRVDGGPQLAAA